MMWPCLPQRPECIKDPESTAGLAKSWAANLSQNKLPHDLEMRKAIQQTAATILTSKAEYEGIWILCDNKGTWVVVTYAKALESQVAARNFRTLFKTWSKEVLNTIENTRRFFNESHQARIQKLTIRNEILYQAEVFKNSKPRAIKENIPAYVAAHELALATPMPRAPEGMPSIIHPGTVALLCSEAEQINLDLEELTEARQKCKAERDALNIKGGYAESPDHLQYEAKSLKIIAYDLEIKKNQTQSESVHAKMTSEKERAAEFAEESDKKYGRKYALWPLGDCGCGLPKAFMFVKSMRDEKGREQFLQESISQSYHQEGGTLRLDAHHHEWETDSDSDSICGGDKIPTPSREGVSLLEGQNILHAAIKKTKEMQENGTLPTDANSHDRARTRKRISKVYKGMTGEAPNDDAVKQLFNRKDSEDKCHYHHICGQKKVTTYCNEGGGPCFLIEKGSQSLYYGGESDMDSGTTKNSIMGEVSIMGQDKIVKFCSEYCCLRYRVHPVCKKCHNDDRTQMLHTRKPTRIDDFIINFTCKHCKLPCFSRDPGVWHTPQKDFSLS